MTVGPAHRQFRPDPRFNDADAQMAEHRQFLVDNLYRTLDEAKHSSAFPDILIEAIQNEVWAHPRQLSQKMVPPLPLAEFVTTPFPRGLGTTSETVRKLIAGNAAAELAWDRAVRGEHGRSNAPRDPKTGRLVKVAVPKSDNIRHKIDYGTSAAGGMRRLDKAAAAGDGKAAVLLRQVTDFSQPDDRAQGLCRNGMAEATRRPGHHPASLAQRRSVRTIRYHRMVRSAAARDTMKAIPISGSRETNPSCPIGHDVRSDGLSQDASKKRYHLRH